MTKTRLANFLPSAGGAIFIGLMAGSFCGTANAADAPQKPPLSIAKEGNFYAGGTYDAAHPNHHIVGQMFVEYQIPTERKHPFPIVMIHGGDQTGAGWFSTPDGREGWAQFFLRRGYAVYVADQVGRGRSPYTPEVYGAMDSQSRDYVMQKFSQQEHFKLWPQAALHTQWPGTGQPGDPVFDQYWASDVPSMATRIPESRMNVAALAKLLDKIGPAIILVHSQSGALAWPLAQARPALVKAIVAAEPSGPPVHQVVVRSAQRFEVGWEKAIKQNEQDYYRDLPRTKEFGLGDVPLTYIPAVTPQSPLQFEQEPKAQATDFARCWRQKEPARKLAVVGDRPIMLLGAEASFYAGYNHCNVQYLEQAGVHVDYLKLADLGIHGNGHMMMFEKNSDQVAGVIADWLDKKVTPLERGQKAQ